MTGPATEKEFARLVEEVSAAATFYEAAGVWRAWTAQGVMLDEEQFEIVNGIAHEKPRGP